MPDSPAATASTVLFGSLDAGRSVYVSSGFKRALSGDLDRSGFIVLGESGAGRDSYISACPCTGRVTVQTARSFLSVGHQSILEGNVATVLLGLEIADRTLSPSDPFDHQKRTRWGPRVQVEWWSQSHPDWLSTATVIASLPRREIWGRASIGWRPASMATEPLGFGLDGVHIGPEIATSVQQTYSEARIGLHVTGVRLGPGVISLSGGWRTDSDGQSGAYSALTAYWRY